MSPTGVAKSAYWQRSGLPPQVPVLQVSPSQQGWPISPQAMQVAPPPKPEQVVPGWAQKRGVAVPPISQQGWPTPPQVVFPAVQVPLALHVPALPPHSVPAAMHSWSSLRQPPAVQALPVQAGWPAAPQGPHMPPLQLSPS